MNSETLVRRFLLRQAKPKDEGQKKFLFKGSSFENVGRK
jgi:hypothetical protein